MALWLAKLGAQVYGFSREPHTVPSNFHLSNVSDVLSGNFISDILDRASLHQALKVAQPEIIFHLAAQPLVRESYAIPHETHEINYMGTCNLLESIRNLHQPCSVVIITTDKVYENREQLWGYRETDRLGGYDPYSASKAAVELLVSSYRASFFHPSRIDEHGVRIATTRAGNVIGGGDWSKDRIIPDIVSSIVSQRPIVLRSPSSVRPWQHVLEPISGYLKLGIRMLEECHFPRMDSWNFGPGLEGNQTVLSLVQEFCHAWGSGRWECQTEESKLHETNVLRLSIDQAIAKLGWKPIWNFGTTVEKTVRWYQRFHKDSGCMRSTCLQDIDDYSSAAGTLTYQIRSAA